MLETTTLDGIINGDTIKLDVDPHFASGRKVRVTIHAHSEIPTAQAGADSKKRSFEEAVRRTAGALADDPEADAILEQLYEDRKHSRPEIE